MNYGGRLGRLWGNLMSGGFNPANASVPGQVYVINAYTLLAFCSLTLFGLLHIFSERNFIVGYLELTGAGVMALNVLGLRLTHNIILARNSFLAGVIVMLVVMLETGGTQGTGVFWFFVFPVAAFFLAGKKQGMWWMMGLFGATGLTVLLAQLSVITIAYTFIEVRQLLASVLVVAVGVYVYQRSRETLQESTRASKRALRAEKVQAETVLAIINEGVLAIDNDGRIIMMNPAAEKMLGWKFTDLASKRFMDTVPMVDAQGQVVKQAGSARALGYRRKDGSSFPAMIVAQSITVGGRVQGTLITFRDVTEERAVERAKTEFVTVGSHQLRTPISAIAWLTELLLDDAANLTAEQRQHIQQIEQSNERMAALVADMLMVSSLELDNVQIRPEPVDLAELCHKVLAKQLAEHTAHKKLKIAEHYASDLGVVRFDISVCKVILSNLLANAIKYTPSGGSVTVAIKPADDKIHQGSHSSVLITVSDSGYGIPKAEQSKILTKFFRASNIRNKDTDGTGLGLFIVHTLAEYVGGRMSFESVEGKGTTFSVLLPAETMTKK